MVCQGLQGEDDPILAATKKGWENNMSRSSNKLGGVPSSHMSLDHCYVCFGKDFPSRSPRGKRINVKSEDN